MSQRLEFRQSIGERAFNAVVVVGGIGILAARMVTDGGASLWIAVSLAVAFVALYMWRMLGMSVLAERDELIVRNLWWTTRLRRSVIEGFRISGIYRPPYKTIKVDRRLGSAVHLDVFLSSALSPSGRRRRQDAVDRLYDWLDAA
jgi:hypothetical protein